MPILSQSVVLNIQVLPLGKDTTIPSSLTAERPAGRFEYRSNSKKRLSDLKRKEPEGKNGSTVPIVLTNIAIR